MGRAGPYEGGLNPFPILWLEMMSLCVPQRKATDMEDRILKHLYVFTSSPTYYQHAIAPSKWYRPHLDTFLQLRHSHLCLSVQHHAYLNVSTDSLANGRSVHLYS